MSAMLKKTSTGAEAKEKTQELTENILRARTGWAKGATYSTSLVPLLETHSCRALKSPPGALLLAPVVLLVQHEEKPSNLLGDCFLFFLVETSIVIQRC